MSPVAPRLLREAAGGWTPPLFPLLALYSLQYPNHPPKAHLSSHPTPRAHTHALSLGSWNPFASFYQTPESFLSHHWLCCYYLVPQNVTLYGVRRGLQTSRLSICWTVRPLTLLQLSILFDLLCCFFLFFIISLSFSESRILPNLGRFADTSLSFGSLCHRSGGSWGWGKKAHCKKNV